jgi:hypothetical protein
VEEEKEVVVVEEGDCCTVIERMVRRKEEGKRGLPQNYTTNSYIPSTSTYLSPLF